jgi:hypothetical protein
MTAVKRRTFPHAAAAFILLLAVITNISYLGHWGSAAAEHAPVHSAAEAEEHAEHCHLGPSRCSGQQSLVGAFWLGDGRALLTLVGALRHVDVAEVPLATDAPAAPPAPPPRPA